VCNCRRAKDADPATNALIDDVMVNRVGCFSCGEQRMSLLGCVSDKEARGVAVNGSTGEQFNVDEALLPKQWKLHGEIAPQRGGGFRFLLSPDI
jgi:hypothetical protein